MPWPIPVLVKELLAAMLTAAGKKLAELLLIF
jgi:hypothetical protein